MGWCGSCFRILGFALVPLLAILAYFQLECMAEEKSGEAQVRFLIRLRSRSPKTKASKSVREPI